MQSCSIGDSAAVNTVLKVLLNKAASTLYRSLAFTKETKIRSGKPPSNFFKIGQRAPDYL